MIDKISTVKNNYNKKQKLKEILDNQLDDHYPSEIVKIDSLRKLEEKISVSRITIIDWIKKYLHERFGPKYFLEIYNNIWTSRSFHSRKQVDDSKFELFRDIMERQIKLYPNNIESIEGLRQLSKKIGISRITLTNWIKKFLINKKGPITSRNMYNKIWSNRTSRFTYGKEVTYDRIKKSVLSQNGTLITSETEFIKMKGRPNAKFIEIICSKKHYFTARLDRLLYKGSWCPQCLEYKTQKVMRLFMEKIFCVLFPETSFHKAYGPLEKTTGRYRWDGYNESVRVNESKFKIAFEYDGIQHDIFPNSYHRTRADFLKQIENDKKKEAIALQPEIRTIVIRLKAINGYDFTSINLFEREIINQFLQATGVNLDYKGYLFDIETFTLKKGGSTLDKFLDK